MREGRARSPGETPARLALAINPERGRVRRRGPSASAHLSRSPPFRGVFDSAPRFRPSPFGRAHSGARGPDTAGRDLRSGLFRARPRKVARQERSERRTGKRSGRDGKGERRGGGQGKRKNDGEERHRAFVVLSSSRGGDVASLVKFGIWHNRRHSLPPSPSRERAGARNSSPPPPPPPPRRRGGRETRVRLRFADSASSGVPRCLTSSDAGRTSLYASHPL
jgi:hypothetical protein